MTFARMKISRTVVHLVPPMVCFLLLTLSLYDDVPSLSTEFTSISGKMMTTSTNTASEQINATAHVDVTESANEVSTRDATTSSHLIVFFLQISKSTVSQFPRLLSRLYHPANVYIIHFDTDISAEAGHQLVINANLSTIDELPANVHLLAQEPINYRGISMTLNTLSAMTLALKVSPTWRYFINLSGADYPTVSPSVIRELLSHPGRSRVFLTAKAHPELAKKQFMQRASNLFIDPSLTYTTKKGAAYNTYIENPLTQLIADKVKYSEAWMIAHREFCEFATSSSESRRLLISLGYSLSSPEHYFATLLSLSPFKNDHIRQSLRLIKWRWRGKSAGQHPYALDDIYDADKSMSDALLKSPFLFARKLSRSDSKLKDVYDERAELPQRVRYVRWHLNAHLGFEQWSDKPEEA